MRAAHSFSGAVRAGALALALMPAPLLAQTASPGDDAAGFRLQPSAPPRAQGPVDEKAPPPTPATPSPAPSASSPPAPTASATVAPTVAPTPSAPPPSRPTRTAEPRPNAAPSPSAAAPAATGNPAPAPVPAPLPTAAPLPAAPAPEASAPIVEPSAAATAAPAGPASRSTIWMALAAAIALAAALGGWLWWRTRNAPRALPAPDFVAPRVPPPAPAAEPVNASPPAPAPAPAPLAEPGPALVLALEATRMSATLVNATLAYRISVTNGGSTPLHDVAITGDMTSAHASRPAEELLGATAGLAPLHGIAGLAPGESVTLGGELRLPLAAILPIRRGDAHLFVPLARFAAAGRDPAGDPVEVRRAFLVGQPGRVEAGGRLQPFRLDLGPRVYSEVEQRALA